MRVDAVVNDLLVAGGFVVYMLLLVIAAAAAGNVQRAGAMRVHHQGRLPVVHEREEVPGGAGGGRLPARVLPRATGTAARREGKMLNLQL